MKICPNCGKENLDKSFCTGCGFDITNVESEEDRINREQNEKQLELKRKELEEKEKQLELEREEREEKERQLELEREEKEMKKRKLKSRLKIISVLIIIIAILSVGIYLQMNNKEIDTPINSVLNSDNQDTVDESINTHDDEVKLKKVDFNGLFKMYVPQDRGYYEYTSPQYKSTYHWMSNNSYASENIYYYNSSNKLNDIVSIFGEAYPGLQLIQEGNLIILSADSGFDLVGVQSQDNEFVFISGYDLEDSKTFAKSIVFD